jgi:hypothetical protein
MKIKLPMGTLKGRGKRDRDSVLWSIRTKKVAFATAPVIDAEQRFGLESWRAASARGVPVSRGREGRRLNIDAHRRAPRDKTFHGPQ